jgi:hypothetical protein
LATPMTPVLPYVSIRLRMRQHTQARRPWRPR